MKRIINLIVLISFSFAGQGQNFKTEFTKYFSVGDTVMQLEILRNWELADSNDAELYTCYLNYYFGKARKEIVVLTDQKPEGESLAFEDSTGKIAGYLGSQITYDTTILKQGFEKIDRGIKLYPNRLDMRFGKIYALGKAEDWDRFTGEIVKAIVYSTKNKNEWTWTNNEKRKDGKEFFLSTIQDYQRDLYNTGDDSLLVHMRMIANIVLTFYPDNIESWNYLAVSHIILGDYQKGLEALKRAEDLNPKDPIVLGNIAECYHRLGDIDNAIEYYEKTIKASRKGEADYAKRKLEELKK